MFSLSSSLTLYLSGLGGGGTRCWSCVSNACIVWDVRWGGGGILGGGMPFNCCLGGGGGIIFVETSAVDLLWGSEPSPCSWKPRSERFGLDSGGGGGIFLPKESDDALAGSPNPTSATTRPAAKLLRLLFMMLWMILVLICLGFGCGGIASINVKKIASLLFLLVSTWMFWLSSTTTFPWKIIWDSFKIPHSKSRIWWSHKRLHARREGVEPAPARCSYIFQVPRTTHVLRTNLTVWKPPDAMWRYPND